MNVKDFQTVLTGVMWSIQRWISKKKKKKKLSSRRADQSQRSCRFCYVYMSGKTMAAWRVPGTAVLNYDTDSSGTM